MDPGAAVFRWEMKRAGSPNLPALFVIAATHVAMHCHDTGSAWVRDR